MLRWLLSGLCESRDVCGERSTYLSLFVSSIFNILIGLGQTSSHVCIPLAAKAMHVHKLFKQYREKVRSQKSLTISPVSVKSDSFQHLILWYILFMKKGSHCTCLVLLPFSPPF